MPCPLKVPFEQQLSQWLQGVKKRYSRFPRELKVFSNANYQREFFPKAALWTRPEELPDVMIAPGLNGFYHRGFMDRFKKTGCFGVVGPAEVNPGLRHAALPDPDRHYTMLGFNPTVWVVDRTVHRDLPVPERWPDLLDPAYRGLIALRGYGETDFCEGILLDFYREGGIAAVRALGEAVQTGLHPSQMVKYAGSSRPDAPAVAAIPYSFAKLVKTNERVMVVWPKDGAIVNPLVMLVKRSCVPASQELASYIAGADIGGILAGASFPSLHPEVDNRLPENASLKWLGWDFIGGNDLGELIPALDREMTDAVRRTRR
jgi:ABC-type Fe3+ transport system substrate-binding protein